MTFHLIAFATNCTSIERASVTWAIASQDTEGRWHDWCGREIIPFRIIPIDLPNESISSGWIEYIQKRARESVRPTTLLGDLTLAMGLTPSLAKPFPRRL